MLLGAVCCEACYVVIGKQLTGNLSPRRISALINLWGLVLVTPFGLWQALTFDFGGVRIETWALLVFYAASIFVHRKSLPASLQEREGRIEFAC